MKHEPEITIARGRPYVCVCSGEAHDTNVAVDRALHVCPPCTKALYRVGAVLLKSEPGLQLEPCSAPESAVAFHDVSGDGNA